MLRTYGMNSVAALQEVKTLEKMVYEWNEHRHNLPKDTLSPRLEIAADRIIGMMKELYWEYARVNGNGKPATDETFVAALDDIDLIMQIVGKKWPPNDRTPQSVCLFMDLLSDFSYLILERISSPGSQTHLDQLIGGLFWNIFDGPMLPLSKLGLTIMASIAVPELMMVNVQTGKEQLQATKLPITHVIEMGRHLLDEGIPKDKAKNAIMRCMKTMFPAEVQYFSPVKEGL